MSKKILIHTIAFSPDGVSTAYLYNDISLRFKEEGYEVVVLSTTPQYNVIQSQLEKQPLTKKCLGIYFESEYNGIKVKHIFQKKFKSSILRIIGFVFWHIISLFLIIFEKKIDIILSPSPPLTIGIVNILMGKIKKAKVIYNVQEIYPDLLIEKGKLRSRMVIFILKKIEQLVYNYSDAVTTIDSVFYYTILDRLKDKSKLHIIPNFVDIELYRPINKSEIILDKTYFPSNDSLKLMYAGNIGYAQDWNIFISLANALKNDNVDFFVIGEGVMRDVVEREIIEKRLSRVHLVPYQDRALMPYIIAYSDIHFIFMSPETEGNGFPSKVYSIMACSKPLIVCSGVDTPIVNFLKTTNAAFLITEKDLGKKVEQIVDILYTLNSDMLQKKGKDGFDVICNHYSKSVVTKMYVDLCKQIISE